MVSPSEQTDALVKTIQQIGGLIGLRVHRGVSVHPPGDVVSIEVTTAGLFQLLPVLDDAGVGVQSSTSASTSVPKSIITASEAAETLATEANELSWEEMELTIGNESNMSVNNLIVMAISGILAAIGISTDSLHLVIGAMVIAPGFEPITRVSLGLVARGRAWRRGLADIAKGYLSLAIAAAIMALVLKTLGTPPLGGSETYLPAGALTSYWTTITATGLIATAVASIAGAVLISSNGSVLTAGVMIALALVPSATIASMALVTGDLDTAGKALLRWSMEVASVAAFSALVFLWKRTALQPRPTRL